MKEVGLADIKNSKNEMFKDYCDRLWNVAENTDAGLKSLKKRMRQSIGYFLITRVRFSR